MSFREKCDWLSFATLWLFAIYFFQIGQEVFGDGLAQGAHSNFNLFWVLVGLQLAIQVAVQVVLEVRSPGVSKTLADERERLIEIKAVEPAYAVLGAGTFLTMGTMHIGFNTWQFANCILFFIWVAELLRYGMRLFYYRRAV
nr:hypothetical protein [uncultured Rhodoferax sp.]